MSVAVNALAQMDTINFYQNDDARFQIYFATDFGSPSDIIMEVRKGQRIDSPLVKRINVGDGINEDSTTQLSVNLTTPESGVFYAAIIKKVGDTLAETIARGKIIVTTQITRI